MGFNQWCASTSQGGGREWDLKSMVCQYINRRRKRVGFEINCVSVYK